MNLTFKMASIDMASNSSIATADCLFVCFVSMSLSLRAPQNPRSLHVTYNASFYYQYRYLTLLISHNTICIDLFLLNISKGYRCIKIRPGNHPTVVKQIHINDLMNY